MMKPGEPRGLRDVVGLPQFAGVWTWSRGGGWEGPFITNELWCDLNTYVVSQFVIDPKRSEEEISISLPGTSWGSTMRTSSGFAS